MVLNFRLGMLNIVRLLHFDWFVEGFVVHSCSVLVLRNHGGVHVGLISAARASIFVKLDRQVHERLLESMR